MRLWRSATCIALLVAFCPALRLVQAQGIQLGDFGDTHERSEAHRQRVSVETEPLTVTAGQPEWIELRFHVAPGFHINSHQPHDEMLIPTALKLTPSPQYKLLKEEYPAGTPLHLSIGAGETLSTYGGDFRVRLQIVAAKGESTFAGTLHYQPCDTASCYPPRDLPVSLPLSVR